jgi:transcriptional regulator
MRFQPFYAPPPAAVDAFVRGRAACKLITLAVDGRPRCGFYPHALDDGSFVLHMNRIDEQLEDLRRRPRALVVFDETPAIVASHWVDEKYAGAATAYFRWVEYDCAAEVAETADALKAALQKLIDRHQPEGKYAPLDPSSEVYKASFAMLALVRLTPTSTRAKWKLGQNRPAEVRRRVAAKLRERARPEDLAAAGAVEDWLSREAP